MAKFISKCSNLVLTMKPSRRQVFDGILVPIPGEHIRFQNGEYETDDPKEIEFIRNHPRASIHSIFEEKTTKKGRGQE